MVNVSEEEFRKLLSQSGYVSKEDIEKSFLKAKRQGRNVADILIGDKIISEEILAQMFAKYYGVSFINLDKIKIPQSVLDLVPEDEARKFAAIPINKAKNKITIATTDPSNLEMIEAFDNRFKIPVVFVMATEKSLREALLAYKRGLEKGFGAIIEENVKKARASSQKPEDTARDVPVIKILNSSFDYALTLGASDIHFEPQENRIIVRFRVDGVLRDVYDLPISIYAAIVSRIKILADLKIDEHRLPQDGRIEFDTIDQKVFFRVSVVPTYRGERIVLRILLESRRPYSLSELGVSGEDMEKLQEEAQRPHGMILSTGPTGSGKTTTLYSLITFIKHPGINILTVEDPVEYGIDRVSQMQANAGLGLSFGKGLRAILRQDPDAIMIGEIRDKETAKTAVDASLTGHIVLSSLHTNDAASAIPRMLDLGVEDFLLASTLRAVIAQRLVRKVCTNCVKPVKLSSDPSLVAAIKDLAIRHDVKMSYIPKEVYKPQGCEECRDGYKGRTGIYEVLIVTPDIVELILKKSASPIIKKKARENGMTTMLEEGLKKVQAGVTTLDEVIRVVRD